MTLQKKQLLFNRLTNKLETFMLDNGYEFILGYSFRCKSCKVGAEKSNHKICLAKDYELFKDGKYLTKTSDHEMIGKYWETLNPRCRWGGRFSDGNHYSLIHNGMK